ncbi:MAG: hypothetical protein AAB431_03345 [Patescibacteria group bacterium]
MNENLEQAIRRGRQYNTETKEEKDKETGETIGTITTRYVRLLELPSVGLKVPQGKLKSVKDVPANEKWPAYKLVNLAGVRIHLCDGIAPDAEGRVMGRLELNARVTSTSRTGGHEDVYLNMSILPAIVPIVGKPRTLITCHVAGEGVHVANRYDDRYGPDSNEANVLLEAL